MYDKHEIEKRVHNARGGFLGIISSIGVFSVSLLTLIIIDISDTITTLSLIGEFLLVLALYITIGKFHPSVLFSREITGKNIKEDEYVSSLPVGSSLGYRQIGSRGVAQPFAPNTRANKRRTPPNLRASVYLRLEDGTVALISGLMPIHIDIYEDGDTLLRYSGTRYPIVTNKTVMRQPCPICGEVNEMVEDACHGCGLTIIEKSET